MQLILRVGPERIPDAGRDVRCIGTSGVTPRVADLLERGSHHVTIPVERPRAVDADRPSRRARDALRPEHSGNERRTALLHRWRADRIGAVERRLTVPDAPHGRHLLVHPLEAARERRVDGAVVVLASADADAHGEPAVGEHVDRCHLLGDGDGVVGGQDHDRRPEPHPFGERSRRRELHGEVMAGVGDALRDSEARPRSLVDPAAPGEHVGAGVREHGGQRHGEVHGLGRYGPLPTTARRDGKRAMKLGVVLGYWGAAPREGFVELAQEAERLGYDSIWVAESWGNDAFTFGAWVAAHTSTIKIGTGVVQIAARTPTATAMAAVTLDHLSNGRLILGLGVSGPQVVEGWYGQPSNKPLARTREYIEVIRPRVCAARGRSSSTASSIRSPTAVRAASASANR